MRRPCLFVSPKPSGAWSSASSCGSGALGPASFTLSRTAVDSRKTKRAQTIYLSFENHEARGELSAVAEIGDQGDFVIFALDCVSPTDTKNRRGNPDSDKKGTLEIGPTGSTTWARLEGTIARMWGDSGVEEKSINGHHAVGQKFRERVGEVRKTLHSLWKRKGCFSQ